MKRVENFNQTSVKTPRKIKKNRFSIALVMKIGFLYSDLIMFQFQKESSRLISIKFPYI